MNYARILNNSILTVLLILSSNQLFAETPISDAIAPQADRLLPATLEIQILIPGKKYKPSYTLGSKVEFRINIRNVGGRASGATSTSLWMHAGTVNNPVVYPDMLGNWTIPPIGSGSEFTISDHFYFPTSWVVEEGSVRAEWCSAPSVWGLLGAIYCKEPGTYPMPAGQYTLFTRTNKNQSINKIKSGTNTLNITTSGRERTPGRAPHTYTPK